MQESAAGREREEQAAGIKARHQRTHERLLGRRHVELKEDNIPILQPRTHPAHKTEHLTLDRQP